MADVGAPRYIMFTLITPDMHAHFDYFYGSAGSPRLYIDLALSGLLPPRMN